ncbi:hypothetical protein PPL_10939 [Heterostelium album PN500]|uniref:Major facilitator superfamily (MFS) profile domain-containing protein n=1 Tax=Heterostelium pallidum (strain ATCC 26659 / Pp 5 / PN500) TaxID=670386 RepID=D3BSH1_HETP5|nr:hypothetical protein PPL_10939 [Heterostelium album PN500]EFA75677.1 hypothetical protein PPL_10939 [Heterostelium album PN500]|eukprot:XP_020427811.1 hypothetical protein PPL_10939 [Heterostelium album PN500]
MSAFCSLFILLFLNCIDYSYSNSIENNNNINNQKEDKVKNKNNNKPILKFNTDNTFKILQITDLHYGEDGDWDKLNIESQEILIESEQPDFVMLSGDMISGYTDFFTNITNYNTIWDTLTLPMRKRNIPWSITFGNHDDEGAYNRLNLTMLDMSYDLSLTQIGPSNVSGVANYVLEVQSSDSTDMATLIYIFDSMKSSQCESMNGDWGCVDHSQVEWYEQTSKKYNRHTGFAFVHVPPIEVVDLWNTRTVRGDFGERLSCCFGDGSHLVESMIERGDIRTLYFGHDHRNDFQGDFFGLNLGYGRKSGYGSYDPKYTQGARVLKIYEKTLTHETWIRNVKGERDDQISHTPLDEQPRYCCVGLDSKDNPSWSLYFALFTCVMIILFFIQWKISSGVSHHKQQLLLVGADNTIQMMSHEEINRQNQSNNISSAIINFYDNSLNNYNGIEIRHVMDDSTSSIESPLSSYNDDNFINKLIGKEDSRIPSSLRFSEEFEDCDSDSDTSGILSPPIIVDQSDLEKKEDIEINKKKSRIWNKPFLKDKLCIIIFLSLALVIRVASAKLLIPNIFTNYVRNEHPNFTNDEVTSMASKYKSVSDSLPYITNFLFSPLLGALSDKFGRKWILAFITLTQIIDMVVVGITFWFDLIWPFYISHTIAGVTNGALPITLSYLADLTTKSERSVWFMIVGASVGISVACGPLLEMFLIQLYSYKAAVIGNVSVLLISYLFLLPIVDSIKYIEGKPKDPILDQFGQIPKEKLGSLNPFKSIIRLFTTSKFIGVYALLYFSFTYTSQDTINTAYYYTNIRYGWGALQNSINTSAVGASVFIWSSFILPILLKFISERKIVIGAFLLSAIFHVLFAFAVNQWMWAVSMSLGSFSMVLLNLIQSIISKATPSHIQGAMLTGVSALSSLSSAAGAYASQNIFAYFISANAPIYFPGMHFLINSGIIFITSLVSVYASRIQNPEETQQLPPTLKKSLLDDITLTRYSLVYDNIYGYDDSRIFFEFISIFDSRFNSAKEEFNFNQDYEVQYCNPYDYYIGKYI